MTHKSAAKPVPAVLIDSADVFQAILNQPVARQLKRLGCDSVYKVFTKPTKSPELYL
jgi:hypothetical protein